MSLRDALAFRPWIGDAILDAKRAIDQRRARKEAVEARGAEIAQRQEQADAEQAQRYQLADERSVAENRRGAAQMAVGDARLGRADAEQRAGATARLKMLMAQATPEQRKVLDARYQGMLRDKQVDDIGVFAVDTPEEMETSARADYARLGMKEDKAARDSLTKDAISRQLDIEGELQRGTPQYTAEYKRRLAEQEKAATTRQTPYDPATPLRQEFQALPVVKNTQEIASAYRKIQSATPSAAGDISLIYGYMKLLDPTSVVREAEFEQAARSGGVPGKIESLYKQIVGQGRLSGDVIAGIKREAADLYRAQREGYEGAAREYRRLAPGVGADPSNVVLDMGNPVDPADEQDPLEAARSGAR